MSLIRQFAIRNELLYSGFVLPNVQIFFVQKISFATFGVSIDDFFTRYAGLGYSLYWKPLKKSLLQTVKMQMKCCISKGSALFAKIKQPSMTEMHHN